MAIRGIIDVSDSCPASITIRHGQAPEQFITLPEWTFPPAAAQGHSKSASNFLMTL
jgi:hypothetical protein